jgi:hypothetical protein
MFWTGEAQLRASSSLATPNSFFIGAYSQKLSLPRVQSSLGFPELVAPHAATGWTCSKQEKLKLTVTLGLATICYNFAVSFPQALFFWHVKNITKEHIFHPEFLFFYLYLQVYGFINSKPTIRSATPQRPPFPRQYSLARLQGRIHSKKE